MLPIAKPWPDPRYFYAADTVGHAKEIAWEALLALVPRQWLRGKPHESKDYLEIRTIWNSSLRLLGMAAPQRIEGQQWDGGVIDESADIPPGVFDRSVVPALSWRNGWCWRIGVPKRHGVGAAEFRRFHESAVAGRIADAMGYTWPSRDIVPAETIEWARQNLSLADYREQFEASFETAGGAAFDTFDEALNVRRVSYVPDRAIVVGCDFNVDPMCWVIGHRWDWGLEWFDELFLRNATTRSALDTLWTRYQRHGGGWEFCCDASGASRSTAAQVSDIGQILNDQRFRSAGLTLAYPRPTPRGTFEANPAVKDRFAACNALFCNAEGSRRMFVDPNCRHLIDDLKLRPVDHEKPNPDGDIGHITDALGYCVWRFFPFLFNQAVTIQKPEVILMRAQR